MKRSDCWWEHKEFLICNLDSSEEGGVTDLVGKEQHGEWLYAVVRWYYGSCTVIAMFKNGVNLL